MADSPDVKKYVDLTVFDENPTTILNDILTTGRGLLPEWQPQVGQIELVLAEAFAVRSAEVANAINRVPSATTEVLLQLFGLTRSDGVKASATLSLTFTETATLPAGTEFLYVNAVTGVSYIFTLDQDATQTLVSPAETVTGTFAVTAQTVGTAYNFSADNESVVLLARTANFLESASFATSPSGGTDAESDATYFSRGVNLLASYTSATTTASQIKYYVSANKTYANRVGVFNRRRYRDRDTTTESYGFHDGAVLVAVGQTVSNAASAGTELAVSASNLTDLYDSLDERTPSGLTIDVMSAELAEIEVNATVKKKTGYTGSTVQTAITNALKSYIDPNTWDFDHLVVRRNEIISLIDSVEGADYVTTLTMNGKTLSGSDNVGYYTNSGGAKSSFTVDIAGAANSTNYVEGAASIFYVDSSSATATPVIYLYSNAEFTTNGSGVATGVTFTAAANGIDYNDETRGGSVVDGTTSFTPVSGDWAGSTHSNIVFSNTSTISGGSADTSTFTPLDSDTDSAVSTDISLRNLGTLVVYGDLNITVV
jgi:hypothetical protein